MRIDFVSDINCPWCALGVAELRKALTLLNDDIAVDLHFQPFELNPQLPEVGKNLVGYLQEKYGMSVVQIDAIHNTLKERGADVGFTFGKRETLWNTVKAHQLLYWAEIELGVEAQAQLKFALMQAYQGEGSNISDNVVLLDVVKSLGFSSERASRILNTNEFLNAVRQREQEWQGAGISAVPSIVINRKHLIQGAQSASTLVEMFRQLAAEAN